jgi:hypothetical protein
LQVIPEEMPVRSGILGSRVGKEAHGRIPLGNAFARRVA